MLHFKAQTYHSRDRFMDNCALCNRPAAHQVKESFLVEYGNTHMGTPYPIKVPVKDIPIWHCVSCEESYYDHDGSIEQEKQVNEYLREHFPHEFEKIQNRKRRPKRRK